MPQSQLNAYLSLAHQLPEIAKQLEIANKLKAIELKLKFNGFVRPIPIWAEDVDKLLKN